jgi:hypothetical protein
VPAPVPLAVARKLAAALDRAGAQPKLYVWQGKRVLDFDVSPQNLRAVTAELARLQLEAPRPGINRLVFDAQ